MALRILMSESEPNDTQPLLRALERYGDVEVVGIAHDGLECAAMANYLAPDVALVRESMAALDGYRTCQLIAQIAPETLSILVLDAGPQHGPGSCPINGCGARGVVSLDNSADQIVALMQRLTRERPSQDDWEYKIITDPSRLPVTIAITGSKGGIGKTTTAVNLSLALQQRLPEQVILVDLVGHFGDVCVMLDLTPQKNILDVAAQREVDEAVLKSMVTHHASGLHVLAGVNSTDTLGALEQMSLTRMAHLLGVLRRMYRVIVVDVPAMAHPLSEYIYQRSDHICLITALSDLTAVRSTAALLQSLLTEHIPSERVKLVVSRYNPQDDYTIEQLEEALHHRVHTKVPWSKEAAGMAANMGTPYMVAKPSSPPAVAVGRLADTLVHELRNRAFASQPTLRLAEVATK